MFTITTLAGLALSLPQSIGSPAVQIVVLTLTLVFTNRLLFS